MRNLTIFINLLSNKTDELLPIFISITHTAVQINLITISSYPRSQSWMHSFKCIQITCGNQDEITWHWFSFNHSPKASVGLASNLKFFLLDCSKKMLLRWQIQCINFINVQHTLMCSMYCSCLDELMRRSLQTSRLKRIMSYVPK